MVTEMEVISHLAGIIGEEEEVDMTMLEGKIEIKGAIGEVAKEEMIKAPDVVAEFTSKNELMNSRKMKRRRKNLKRSSSRKSRKNNKKKK